MPKKAQNWPIFLLKIYRNLLSSICRKIGKMNLSIIIDKLSVIGNSSLEVHRVREGLFPSPPNPSAHFFTIEITFIQGAWKRVLSTPYTDGTKAFCFRVGVQLEGGLKLCPSGKARPVTYNPHAHIWSGPNKNIDSISFLSHIVTSTFAKIEQYPRCIMLYLLRSLFFRADFKSRSISNKRRSDRFCQWCSSLC